MTAAVGTLIFDGDCGFCTKSAQLAGRVAPKATIAPYQQLDLGSYGITADQANAALQWVTTDGTVSEGAAAVARLLIAAGSVWKIAGWLLLLPGIRRVAAWSYRMIARNRYRLPGGTPACRVDGPSAGASA